MSTTTDEIGGGPDSDLEIFLGPKNRAYYLRRFEQLQNGRALTWHWPGFFLTSGWLFYRKMWAWAVVYLLVVPFVIVLISLPVAMVVSAEFAPFVVFGIYVLVLFVIVPLLANPLYRGHVRREIGKVNATNRGEERRLALARAGGTSGAGIIVACVVLLVPATGILAAIGIPAYQDYTIRSQVNEGLMLASGPEAVIVEYMEDRQEYPQSAADLGLAPISGNFVESVDVEEGWLIITYGNQADENIQGKQLFLGLDEDAFPDFVWLCGSDTIEAKWLPAACRL
jgi:type IV pilus assembly protein PilA